VTGYQAAEIVVKKSFPKVLIIVVDIFGLNIYSSFLYKSMYNSLFVPIYRGFLTKFLEC
jgi:hypothetical protein